MIDFFDLLGYPRQPWLDPDAVKERFLSESSIIHPDRVHEKSEIEKRSAHERYIALNAACQCLRDPKQRLMHLFELETGRRPGETKSVPEAIADVFLEVGRLCQQADHLIGERNTAQSAITKVRFQVRCLELSEELLACKQKLEQDHDRLLNDAKCQSERWLAAPPPGSENRAKALPIEQLEAMCHEVGFLTRWISQLEQRRLQLAF